MRNKKRKRSQIFCDRFLFADFFMAPFFCIEKAAKALRAVINCIFYFVTKISFSD